MRSYKKAFTLTGIVIIGIMVTIMAISGIGFYDSLQARHLAVINRCTAINLACAQMEDLFAMNYDANPQLNLGNNRPTTLILTPAQAGFNVNYSVRFKVLPTGTETILGTSITYKTIIVQVVDTHPQGITVQLTAAKVQ